MQHTQHCLEETKGLRLLALLSLGEHPAHPLHQAKVSSQQDAVMQLVEGKTLTPGLACIAFTLPLGCWWEQETGASL